MLLDEEMHATASEIPISPTIPSKEYHRSVRGHHDDMGIRPTTAPAPSTGSADRRRPTRVPIVALLAIACGVLVLGCGRSDDQEPIGTNRGDVELTGDDADRTIEVTIGDSLTMRLGSNPGTGFEWEVTVADDAVVALTGSTYEPGQDDEGSPGRDAIVLTAIGPGQTEVTFDYRRPWETDVEPEQTITVRVEVVGNDGGTETGPDE